MAASAAPRPFCAVCVNGSTGIRPRQLDEGGPVFLVCQDCDESVASDPIIPPRTPGRMRIMSPMSVRILKVVHRLDWITAMDIADELRIPSVSHDRLLRNNFSVNLCRLNRDSFLTRRVGAGAKGRAGFLEYHVTDLGLAVATGRMR